MVVGSCSLAVMTIFVFAATDTSILDPHYDETLHVYVAAEELEKKAFVEIWTKQLAYN